MKKVGSTAGAVVAAALLLHLSTSPAGTRITGQKQASGNNGQSGAEPVIATSEAGTTVEQPRIEGPWLATQTFFHQEAARSVCRAVTPDGNGCGGALDFTKPAQVEECTTSANCKEQLNRYFGIRGHHIQYLIATVPDPLHTRLALFTDSSIEAIEQAAFDSHWEFAAQWLPWYDDGDATEKDPESRRKQRASIRQQESQPGLMIFRHSPVNKGFDENVLFIFLVGETPTAGVNGSEYRIARAYMRAFGEPADVRIVGPTFSGSFYSLAELITAGGQNAMLARNGRPAPQYWVRTGTAANADAAAAFIEQTKANFAGTNENSRDHRRHFDEVLRALGIAPGEAATLVEDDTGFSKGFLVSRGKEEPRVLRFPRDISHLRNVYKDATGGSAQQSASAPALDFSLKDAESGEDSVPVFSRIQTPVSQNAVIGELANEIRGNHIRMLEVAATNVLDSLFLAQLLRRQCPDTRLLVAAPDLLFVQATQMQSLDGILALSSYPLFSASKRWFLDATRAEHVNHSNANAEGIYNAAGLFLLPPEERWRLNDYVWNEREYPPAWLLQLTRQGFSPIRLLENKESDWFQKIKANTHTDFRNPQPAGVWVALTSMLAILSIVLCGWIAHLGKNEQILSWSIPASEGTHIADAYRLMFLVYTLLTLTAAQLILYIPFAVNAVLNRSDASQGSVVVHGLSFIGIAVPVSFSIWLLRKIFEKPRRTAVRYLYAATGFAVLACIALVWLMCCLPAQDEAGQFFSFRAIGLRIGTSPSLPVLGLLAALLVFCVCHLVRFFFAIHQRPRLFTAKLDGFLRGRMRSCRSELNRALVAPMNFGAMRQVRLIATALGVVALAGILVRADHSLATPEGKAYDLLILALATLVILATVATMIEAKLSWGALQPLLVRFDLLPLGLAFSELRDAGKDGPIWARRLNLQSLDIPTRSAIVLHNLKASVDRLQKTSPGLNTEMLQEWLNRYWSPLSKLIGERELVNITTPNGVKLRTVRMTRIELRREFGRLRYVSADVSHELTERILLPEWMKRSLPWGSPESAQGSTAQEQGESKQESPYDLAQTFVALQFSMFINYGVRQIQNLLLAVSLGFGLLVVALSVYPFESPQLIGRLLMAGFVVLAFLTWRVMSQMERDPILSRLSGTAEGALTGKFYLKVLAYGALPILSLLSSQFPAIGGFLSSFVQPSLEALK